MIIRCSRKNFTCIISLNNVHRHRESRQTSNLVVTKSCLPAGFKWKHRVALWDTKKITPCSTSSPSLRCIEHNGYSHFVYSALLFEIVRCVLRYFRPILLLSICFNFFLSPLLFHPLSSFLSLSCFPLLYISQILAPSVTEVAGGDKSEVLTFRVREKQRSELSLQIFPSQAVIPTAWLCGREGMSGWGSRFCGG